jgi:hypothetical protein
VDNPNPVGIQYPRSGQLYMQGEIQRLSAHVCGLIDTLVLKDMRIAQQDAQIEAMQKAIDAMNAQKNATGPVLVPPPDPDPPAPASEEAPPA